MELGGQAREQSRHRAEQPLIVYWLKHRGTRFPVHQGDCILGRNPDSFVVLSSPKTSREHAVVRIGRDGLEIEDLASRNGTLVNGTRIERRRCLEDGDVIELGDERLEVMLRQEKELPSTVDDDAPGQIAGAVAQLSVLEIAEELLLRGSETGARLKIAQCIRSTVEALLRNAQQSGLFLTRAERARLIAVLRVVSRWTTEPDYANWATRVSEQLQNWR